MRAGEGLQAMRTWQATQRLVERGQRAMKQLTDLMNVPLKGGPCEIGTPPGW
jgi:hypothetical protein